MTRQTFVLPDLGEGLTEAEIVRWLVTPGDEVAIDQPVVEVETAKAVVEVPTPFGGRVAGLHGREGETLGVGQPLISVDAAEPAAETYRREERAGSGNVLIGYGTSGEAVSQRRRRPRAHAPRPAATPPVAAAPPVPVAPAPAASAAPVAAAPLVASPLVRRLARDRGLDLTLVRGSGAGGLITRADVERASASPASASPAPASPASASPAPASTPGERRTPLSAFRRAAAAALSRSRSEIPEATVWVDVDATDLVALRESARTPDDPGPGLLAFLARFVVAALREYPVLNSRLDAERQEIVEYDRINLGIAVQGDRGLVVPAVLGAESMSTTRLSEEIGNVVRRARQGRSTAEELAAGTFTLNNYGGFGVDGSAAIIHHPQAAILGFGRILDRPWVVDGEIRIRKITQMSFVFDHRICDGGTAAGFMRSVADAIEHPARAFARF
ncbi:dihydrolipoamide acetyltransferase component of pyruvate dehydrogenase complex [Actinoplanes sp. NBRC 14428]|nr:dihydrolipoamide acetyltransferase component of pyruvate dehydrogenase complex [Actinoplanes sp. NBRC 14428]